MSTTTCFDWPALTAHRHDPQAAEPAAWSEALAHLDGCPDCRRAALAADPTLLFHRLAAPPERENRAPQGAAFAPGSDIEERAEVEAVLQAVSALRAARRVAGRRAGLRRVAGWARWAAAAVLAFLALSLDNEGLPGGPRSAFVAGSAGGAELPAAVSRLPRTDGAATNQVEARIYHLDGDDLSVVMIVDESLDV
jgi:hypothetical protein